MPSNDLHLLDARLDQRRSEVAATMDQDEYFSIFVADLVLRRYQVGLPAVRQGIVDGICDFGVDAMYTFVNGQLAVTGLDFARMGNNPGIDVHVLQTKRSTKFGEEALDKLQVHLPELFDLDRDENALRGRANPALIDVSRNFLRACMETAHRGPHFHFHVHYATRADTIHPNTDARARHLEKTLSSMFTGAEAEVRFYTPADLLRLARIGERVEKNLVMADGPLSSDSERGQGYACLVRLNDLYEFICETGSNELHAAMFDANVRDHYNSSDVNDSIRRSLENSESPDFWWLNNGITIVAPEVQHMGRRLFLVDPKIVNGLQTSNELHKYFRDGGTDDARLVLVKVIKAEDERVGETVIWATNNQNKLPPGALRATDPVQKNIEEYFKRRSFHYDRRKNSHLRMGVRVDKIVSMEALAQSMVACLLLEPWRSRGDVTGLLDDQTYNRIFALDIPLESYLTCLLLTRKIRSILDADRRRFDSAQYVDDFVYHVTAVAVILMTRQKRPNAKELANIDFRRMTPEAVNEALAIVALEYKKYRKSRIIPESDASVDQTTSDAIVERVGRMLNSSHANGWPERRLSSDFVNFGSDVIYSTERVGRGR